MPSTDDEDAAAIRTECPTCNRRLKIPPELSGRRVRCRHCGALFDFPARSPARPADETAEADLAPTESRRRGENDSDDDWLSELRQERRRRADGRGVRPTVPAKLPRHLDFRLHPHRRQIPREHVRQIRVDRGEEPLDRVEDLQHTGGRDASRGPEIAACPLRQGHRHRHEPQYGGHLRQFPLDELQKVPKSVLLVWR
jgi:hypothetical protein